MSDFDRLPAIARRRLVHQIRNRLAAAQADLERLRAQAQAQAQQAAETQCRTFLVDTAAVLAGRADPLDVDRAFTRSVEPADPAALEAAEQRVKLLADALGMAQATLDRVSNPGDINRWTGDPPRVRLRVLKGGMLGGVQQRRGDEIELLWNEAHFAAKVLGVELLEPTPVWWDPGDNATWRECAT